MILKRLSLVLALVVVLVGFVLPCFAETITYQYDDLYRLIKATYADGTVIEYTYDEVGNRLAKVVKPGDSDGDGLPDALEATTCTDPNNPDTDNDGIKDGAEDANANGVVDTGETNPCNADTDGDGMPDGWEVQYGLDPLTNDAAGDLDGDGISNLEEYNQGTDPTVAVTVSISADPVTIEEGQSSTLTWTSTNATACTIEPGIGNVPVTGTIAITPSATTTYTITATGPGGTVTDTVTVTVGPPPPPPRVLIFAYPRRVRMGRSATLLWRSRNADSCEIQPGIGAVDLWGRLRVSPETTTTYTITATGPGGTATDSVTITVIPPRPTVAISVEPRTIRRGESATLSWSSTNAETASIRPEIGPVPINGSVTVSPRRTTRYTISVTGPGGRARDSTRIRVRRR